MRMRHKHTGFSVLLGIVITCSLCLVCYLNEVNFRRNFISHVTTLTFIYDVVMYGGIRCGPVSGTKAAGCDCQTGLYRAHTEV